MDQYVERDSGEVNKITNRNASQANEQPKDEKEVVTLVTGEKHRRRDGKHATNDWKLNGKIEEEAIKRQQHTVLLNQHNGKEHAKNTTRKHQHHRRSRQQHQSHHHHHHNHHNSKHYKERYQRKLNRAMKMQMQREQKLERQKQMARKEEEKDDEEVELSFYSRGEDINQPVFSSVDDINQHIDGVNKEKYPNLARLHTQLQQDRDEEMPPYIRKYNRRNKHLIDILEGTTSPESSSYHQHQNHKNHHQHHQRQKMSHKQRLENWIEENLFEEQRHNPNKIVRPPDDSDHKLNALPGESDPPFDENQAPSNSILPPNRSATRAGNFVYHRIAQSKPSTSIGEAYGVIVRKPGLPFVAITDRRQSPPVSKLRSKQSSNSRVENKMP